jgi:hypothetical protein
MNDYGVIVVGGSEVWLDTSPKKAQSAAVREISRFASRAL